MGAGDRASAQIGASAAAGRHPQAGRNCRKPRSKSLGTVARPGYHDREAPDQARGRHCAAGALLLAREAESRTASCSTFISEARRPTRGRAAPSSGWSRPADRVGRRSPRHRPDPGGHAAAGLLRRIPGCVYGVHAGPLVRGHAGGRRSRLRPLRRRGPPAAGTGGVRLVAVGNVGIPPCTRPALEPRPVSKREAPSTRWFPGPT